MQYLQSAPKSPKQGGSKGPSHPSHYYNYAKQKNPTANPMQFQPQPNKQAQRNERIHNPYATKALPEDRTIENLDAPGNKSTSSLLTILLIGITVVIIVISAGVGCYFLFRHIDAKKSHVTQSNLAKSKENVKSKAEEVEEEVASSDSPEFEEQVTETNPSATYQTGNNALSIYQIYFNNIHDPIEFVGYTPQKQLPYSTLTTLEGIGSMFQTNYGWVKEKESTTNAINNGLCEYFAQNLREIGAYDLSNAVDLCSKEYRLIEYAHDPFTFNILSNTYKYPDQRGISLKLQVLIFKMNNKVYSITYDQPQQTFTAQNPRRRLVASYLPSEKNILDDKQMWIPLPDEYNGKTYHEWKRYHPSHESTMQTHIHIVHGQIAGDHRIHDPNAQRIDLQLLFDQPSWMLHEMHSDTPEQRVIDEQEQDCDPHKLEKLSFVLFQFTLTIAQKQYSPVTWHCIYQPNQEPLHASFSQTPTFSYPPPIYEGHPSFTRHAHFRRTLAAPVGAQKRIGLNAQWWDQILNDENTKCWRDNIDESKPCNIIRKYSEVSQEQRRRLPELDDFCDCLDGCGTDWEIIDSGTTLVMLRCGADIHATNFRGILRLPERANVNDFLFGGAYEAKHNQPYIQTQGIPYWRCTLVEFGQEEEDAFVSEYRRRQMTADEDTSNAWSKDNMFMIIASTIFFIVIGVQSFYWLSHAY